MVHKYLHKFDSLSAFNDIYGAGEYSFPTAVTCSAGTFVYSGGPLEWESGGRVFDVYLWTSGSTTAYTYYHNEVSGNSIYVGNVENNKKTEITSVSYLTPSQGSASNMYYEPWVSLTDCDAVTALTATLRIDEEMYASEQPITYVKPVNRFYYHMWGNDARWVEGNFHLWKAINNNKEYKLVTLDRDLAPEKYYEYTLMASGSSILETWDEPFHDNLHVDEITGTRTEERINFNYGQLTVKIYVTGDEPTNTVKFNVGPLSFNDFMAPIYSAYGSDRNYSLRIADTEYSPLYVADAICGSADPLTKEDITYDYNNCPYDFHNERVMSFAAGKTIFVYINEPVT